VPRVVFFLSINAGGANLPEIRVQRSVRWWNCEECCTVEHRELARGKLCMGVVPLGIYRKLGIVSHYYTCVLLIGNETSCSWNYNVYKIVSYECYLLCTVKMQKGGSLVN
jgi:hypothetical protein